VPRQVCARLSGKSPEYLWTASVATVQLNDRQGVLVGLFSALGWPLPWGCRTPIGSADCSPGHRSERMS